jgi:FMN phosphatase YigB (HAD superfamily)
MILLCDLDGTLLSNDWGSFQPAYLKALGAHLAEKVHPDKMIPELLTGTRKMLENDDPLVTLESAFARHFYSSLGLENTGLSNMIIDFYQQKFPALGRLTTHLPKAVEFVTTRIAANDRVVVATNPFFPQVATFVRLAWAGLPVDVTRFDLVTTYEFMHFTKPKAAYYAEILAYLGYPDEPVLMIGNDFENDILAAQKLGIPGFWLTLSEPIQGQNGIYNHSGSYQDLNDFLSNEFQSVDIYQTNSLKALISILKATLAALHSYTTFCETYPDKDMKTSLHLMISGRFRVERDAVEMCQVHNKLTLNENPIIEQEVNALASFAAYRLAWIKQLSGSHRDEEVTTGSELILLLQSCIANDRKIMMECSQWFKERPRFLNPPTQTGS